jgi:ATP-dependent Lon protease
VWCICDIEYFHSDDARVVPWILAPQADPALHFDFEGYVRRRKQFTTEEWIDLLIQSIGFNPEMFGKRAKLIQLVRLIPFCRAQLQPDRARPEGHRQVPHLLGVLAARHADLRRRGHRPQALRQQLQRRIGLVGYWDVVAFDEFAGKKKRTDKALVDIMKNYMANKSFSRGVETLGAEASMVFVGNTSAQRAVHAQALRPVRRAAREFHDSAYLDRLHFYIPGWEVDIIRGEMFSERLRLRRRLHRRSPQVDAQRRLLRPLPAALHARLGHLHPRPRRHPQDLLRA